MHIHIYMDKYVQICVCKYIVSAVKNFIAYGNVKFQGKMPPAKVKLFCLSFALSTLLFPKNHYSFFSGLNTHGEKLHEELLRHRFDEKEAKE